MSEAQFSLMLEMARSAGVDMSEPMLAIVLDLIRLEVSPQGIVAFLRAVKDARLRASLAAS